MLNNTAYVMQLCATVYGFSLAGLIIFGLLFFFSTFVDGLMEQSTRKIIVIAFVVSGIINLFTPLPSSFKQVVPCHPASQING